MTEGRQIGGGRVDKKGWDKKLDRERDTKKERETESKGERERVRVKERE